MNNLSNKNTLSAALANCGLADQFEMIKIIPATLGREEMAWLWTALKADYRPTFPFQVSVVLMQPEQNVSLALPVLYRQFQAVVSQPAQILQALPPNDQPAFSLTDAVTVTGEFLSNVTQVELTNSRLGIQFTVPVSNVTATSFTCIPGAQTTYPNGIPAGVYQLKAQILAPNSTPANIIIQQSTNELPVALAPTLTAQAVTLVPNPDGTPTVLVTINNIAPGVFEGQTRATVAEQPDSASGAGSSVFDFGQPDHAAVAGGSDQLYLADLRVPQYAAHRTEFSWPPDCGRRQQHRRRELEYEYSQPAGLYRPHGDDMIAEQRTVAGSTPWQEFNQRKLVREFDALRGRLGSEMQLDPSLAAESDAGLEEAAAIDRLAAIFNLTHFERELLLLAAGVEMDSGLADRCAELTGRLGAERAARPGDLFAGHVHAARAALERTGRRCAATPLSVA